MSRKVRSVSFNPDCPFEKEMLDHADTLPNFSNFIKKLYLNFLKGESAQERPKQVISTATVEQPVINQDYMRQLI